LLDILHRTADYRTVAVANGGNKTAVLVSKLMDMTHAPSVDAKDSDVQLVVGIAFLLGGRGGSRKRAAKHPGARQCRGKRSRVLVPYQPQSLLLGIHELQCTLLSHAWHFGRL